ncbi:hypothetical protein [Enterococcus sp.]|uniref:hypothetical protein n=1 Tax=Enterococcus sp. TaxID=35783 RepID=UPI002FC6667F
MKVISKKLMPSVEFGDKVRLLADSNEREIRKGDIGVAVAGADSDGDIEVHNSLGWDYVAAENLEVLQKFNGDTVTSADKSAVIELAAEEVGFIAEVLDRYTAGPLKREFTKLKAEVA